MTQQRATQALLADGRGPGAGASQAQYQANEYRRLDRR
jgi:hypothetical protein